MENRYSRHILLEQFGEAGQAKVSSADLIVIGCGGLGCLVATYLAGAGVRSLTLIDGDSPDISNLHRQVLYDTDDDRPKSISLAEKLKKLNPNVSYTAVTSYLDKGNIEQHLGSADLIIECTDDQACKYLVNDYCALEQIPLVYGAIHKYEGYVSLFRNLGDEDIHLRDIFPQPDMNIPTCSEVGVLSTTAGLISMLQANEALKYIAGIGENLVGKLLTYNVLENRQMTLNIKKAWDGDLEKIYETTEYTPLDCMIVPTISVTDLMAKRDNYTLLTTLSDKEHDFIDETTIQISTSDHKRIIELSESKPAVIYCRSGKQTKALLSRILTKHPNANVYNLEGGYLAYQKFKALS